MKTLLAAKRSYNRWLLWWINRKRVHASGFLEIIVDGNIHKVRPKGIAGLMLCIDMPGAANRRMISSVDVSDPQHFWRWWRHLGGRAMLDEDGDLFIPWD